MNYRGIIIEESLKDKKLPDGVKIISSIIEEVTDHHKTPWLKKWTLHNVEVDENKVEQAADIISRSFETEHTSWYADFKNELFHYVMFPGKVFKISNNKEEYQKVIDYGLSLGIPDYQLNFKELKRT